MKSPEPVGSSLILSQQRSIKKQRNQLMAITEVRKSQKKVFISKHSQIRNENNGDVALTKSGVSKSRAMQNLSPTN